MIPSSRRSQLVSLCEARWVERQKAVIVFGELFAAILYAQQEIENSDALALGNAEGLKLKILTPDFIYNLKILEHVLGITLPLSTALQSKDIDMFSCCEMIDDIKVQIQQEISGIVEEFATIFVEGSAPIKKHEIRPL